MRFLRQFSIASACLLAGCDVLNHGVLNAAGPIAESQRHLLFVLSIVLLFIAGPVLVLTPLIAWHYRLSNKDAAFRPRWTFSWSLEALIWVPPSMIVIGLGILLWDDTHRLDPYRPIASAMPATEIQAVALNWKWLFIYPDHRIAAVNQLVIPAGQPIHLQLTSGTVMQSILIPQLAGQIYAMAGMRTQLNLAANQPGVYQGANVQYNGSGFQNQRFNVVALSPQDYQSWLTRVQETQHPLDVAACQQLFMANIVAQPRVFSLVQDGLFQSVVAHGQTPDCGAGQ